MFIKGLSMFYFSSPLRYLVTPSAKNLTVLFDELSWKVLEKRPKFPHVTEGNFIAVWCHHYSPFLYMYVTAPCWIFNQWSYDGTQNCTEIGSSERIKSLLISSDTAFFHWQQNENVRKSETLSFLLNLLTKTHNLQLKGLDVAN